MANKLTNKEKVLNYAIKAAPAMQKAYAEFSDEYEVTFSDGNDKMGHIYSVSRAPLYTCRHCKQCSPDCYAIKLAKLRPGVLESYARNTAIAEKDPVKYWAAVNRTMRLQRFFRFHVAGDIKTADYFAEMVQACRNNPHCIALCFTKCYDIVNDWMDKHGDLPENLRVIFSHWDGLEMQNPYNLPESHVYPKKAECPTGWHNCGGNCENCAADGVGCWYLSKGEIVGFKKH